MDRTYEVGYGKTPKHTRFRTGFSGNPRGRPKGRRNLVTVLEEVLQEKVVIRENGVRKTVTKLEAAIKRLAGKAASGDMAAIRQLTALAFSTGVGTRDIQARVPLSEADRKIMDGVVKRLQQAEKGNPDDI